MNEGRGAQTGHRGQASWLACLRWSALCLLVTLAVAAIAIPILRHFGFEPKTPGAQNELSSG
jgi:hypothetical protein